MLGIVPNNGPIEVNIYFFFYSSIPPSWTWLECILERMYPWTWLDCILFLTCNYLSILCACVQGVATEIKSMSQKASGAYSPSKTWLSKINLTSGMRFFQGGSSFVLVFWQALPPEVESARADFGMKTVADLKRVNAFNLIGRIPGKFFYGLNTRKMFYTSFFRVRFLHLTLFFVNCFFFFFAILCLSIW